MHQERRKVYPVPPVCPEVPPNICVPVVCCIFAMKPPIICVLYERKKEKNFEKETGMKSRHTAKNNDRKRTRKEKLVLVILLFGAAVISRHQ